ncbi:MAG: hypothetical protein HRT54_07555 [Colwellia sp.]|nr:hypothetical protein [Colwellia sp.]
MDMVAGKEKRSSAGRGRGRRFLGAIEHAGSSTEFLSGIKNIPASLYAQAHLRAVFFAILVHALTLEFVALFAAMMCYT